MKNLNPTQNRKFENTTQQHTYSQEKKIQVLAALAATFVYFLERGRGDVLVRRPDVRAQRARRGARSALLARAQRAHPGAPDARVEHRTRIYVWRVPGVYARERQAKTRVGAMGSYRSTLYFWDRPSYF
jgi:hypothetical protein